MPKKIYWEKYGKCPVCKVASGSPCANSRTGGNLYQPHQPRRNERRSKGRELGGKLRCGRCKEYKVPQDFHQRGNSLDGYDPYCRDCKHLIKITHRYSITVKQYEEMFEEQGGKCALCGEECGSGKRLAVDHCHKTGKVRGLLCQVCNMAISRVEIPGWAKKAVAYVNHHRKS